MDKILTILKVNRNDKKTLCRSRCVVSIVLGLAAAIMLIMNVKNQSMDMANASVILVVGFLISGITAGVLKKENISAIIIAILVGFVLSVFVVSGGNEGFAGLWVLLVPLFAINLLGVIPGIIISTYFLLFLFTLFYSPLNVYIIDKYTASFISKFPILYLCDYLIANFYSLQREYFQNELHVQVYKDGLTGTYNRRFYMEKLHENDKSSHNGYGIVMIDLNGLKGVNDNMGHEAGDEMIKAASECCVKAFDGNDYVCRIGGDEFAIIAYGNVEDIKEKINRLTEIGSKWSGNYIKTVSFAVGYAYSGTDENSKSNEIMKIADAEMYKNKSEFYQKTQNNRRRRAD